MTSEPWPARYNMMALLLVALLLCYVDRTIISLAVIDMQKEFGWSNSEKGYVLSIFSAGYIITQLLGGLMSNRYGGRNVYLFAVFAWSLFTVITPAAALISLPALLATRFMLGVAEGGAYPAAYNLIHHWIPAEERSTSISLVSTAAAVGTVGALLVSGKIIEFFGWQSIFYIFGSMGFFWCTAWALKISPTAPSPQGAVSGRSETSFLKSVPWKILITHPAVITLYVVNFGGQAITFLMASWLPSYLVDTFEVSTTQAGVYAILPWLSLAVVTFLAGRYADSCIAAGEASLHLRKRLMAIGFLLSITSVIGIAHADSLYLALMLVIIVFSGVGILIPGISTIPGELLPRHGDVLFGFITASGAIGSIIFVSATGILLEKTGSYIAIFYALAACCTLSMITFHLFSRTEEINY